ncbi:MAG: cupin domain-containing protein [Gammaproteobacteria bacterium]|nr:cupin domain-containing protein [Gammaproteobacteria bacterium]
MNSSVIKVGQLSINYISDGSSTSSLGMFELTVPPSSNVPPPHSHSNNEECVYVLEGTLRYTVGSETKDLTVGQSMSTPKGVVHAFANPFSTTAKALVINSPDIGAQYFKDIAAVVNAGGPPDKAALVGVMSKYGLIPAVPQ